MACRHCGCKVNLNKILCDFCAGKALQVLPADPKERVHIYLLLAESPNPVVRWAAAQLMQDDVEIIEDRMEDPVDRMFDPRG